MATDEEKPEKRTGRRVIEFPKVHDTFDNGHEMPRENVIPPPGIHGHDKDPRFNKAPAKNGSRPGMGKRWADLTRRIDAKEITWDEVAEAMDDQELARRQFKATDGSFQGRPPSRVPLAFVRACDAELVRRGGMQWREAYSVAISTLASIAVAGEKDSDRVKAALAIIERIEGKVADKVVVTNLGAGESVEDLLAGIVAEVAEEEAIARAHDYESRRMPEGQQ